VIGANATNQDWGSSTANGTSPVFGLMLAVLLVLLLVAATVIVYMRSDSGAWLLRIARRAKRTAYLAVLGVVATVPFALVAWAGYGVTQTDEETRGVLWKVFLGGALAIVAFAAIGWLAEKWMIRVRARVAEARASLVDAEAKA